MKLDPKGLEAARELPGTNHEAIIRAYLSTVTPAEVGGLVERLRALDGAILSTAAGEAATALEAQAAELAAKEEARAEQWRLRREAEGSRDAARAGERAAHDAANTAISQRDEARAALAETRKALDAGYQIIVRLDKDACENVTYDGRPVAAWCADYAARRALTGGQEDA